MIERKLLRNNFDLIESSLKKRGDKTDLKELLELDTKLLNLTKEFEEKRSIQKKIKSFNDEAKLIKQEIELINNQKQELEATLKEKLSSIPNIIDDIVPVGKTADDNLEVKKWGEIKTHDVPHYIISDKLTLKDEAIKLSGSRFIIFGPALSKLAKVLVDYMIKMNEARGYELYLVPSMVNKEALYGVGQLPKFKDDAFEVAHKDKWLISTAEVSLSNMFEGKTLKKEELPKKCMAYTSCFRSEAGSAGRDTRGLIRLHEFHKVELVTLSTQEKSEEMHEKKKQAALDILEGLKIPYRVMLLCSGDMGFSAKKQYDIEAWMPGMGRYLEIASCSNCGDFQAKRMNIKYLDGEEKKYAHTLNGSALPVERLIAAIIENNMIDENSFAVPDVLVESLGFSKISIN